MVNIFSNKPVGDKMSKEEMNERIFKAEGVMGFASESITLLPTMALTIDEFNVLQLNKHYPCSKRKKTARSPGLPEADANGLPEDDVIAPVEHIFCNAEYKGKRVHHFFQCYNCSLIGSDEGICKTYIERHIKYGTYNADVKHIAECASSARKNGKVETPIAESDVEEKPKKKGLLASLKEDAKKTVEEEKAIAKSTIEGAVPKDDMPEVPSTPERDLGIPDISVEKPSAPKLDLMPKSDPSKMSDDELTRFVQEYMKRQQK